MYEILGFIDEILDIFPPARDLVKLELGHRGKKGSSPSIFVLAIDALIFRLCIASQLYLMTKLHCTISKTFSCSTCTQSLFVECWECLMDSQRRILYLKQKSYKSYKLSGKAMG